MTAQEWWATYKPAGVEMPADVAVAYYAGQRDARSALDDARAKGGEGDDLSGEGFWWLAEVPEQREHGPFYVKDHAGGVSGWYTNDPNAARKWRTKSECAAWCVSANEWLTSKVEAREHGFGMPRPSSVPEAGAKAVAWMATDDDLRGDACLTKSAKVAEGWRRSGLTVVPLAPHAAGGDGYLGVTAKEWSEKFGNACGLLYEANGHVVGALRDTIESFLRNLPAGGEREEAEFRDAAIEVAKECWETAYCGKAYQVVPTSKSRRLADAYRALAQKPREEGKPKEQKT